MNKGIHKFVRQFREYGMQNYELKERACQILLHQAEQIEKLEIELDRLKVQLEEKTNGKP